MRGKPSVDGGTITGLICLGLFVGAFVAVFWMGRGAAKLGKELPARIARGSAATATITSIRKSGVQNRGSDVFGMLLRVRVEPSGAEPYDARAFCEVRDVDIPQVQPGAVLDVRIDPEEPLVVHPRRFATSVGELSFFLDERKQGRTPK